MINTLGRDVSDELMKKMNKQLYSGPFEVHPDMRFNGRKIACVEPCQSSKLLQSIDEAIDKTGLTDGMTISFHHHYRSGDKVINMVMDRIAKKGIKDLYLAASSLIDVHKPLIEHIKNGVITGITTSGLRGELAQAISCGLMEKPIIFRSHGGRARAIETGELCIDVAFMGVPSSDEYGNVSGERGKTICGALGYARTDSRHADQVVVITDTLAEFPNIPASIKQVDVDYVVVVDEIGDPNGISTGATRFTKNPKELLIAEKAAKVIINSGYFRDGFSFQTGSGGSSLAVTRFLRKAMIQYDIKAKFALGGITETMVRLHEEGLIKHLYDVQSFDLYAANSFKNNRMHHEIEAGYYANPFTRGCIANKLDVVILSALEIDVNFNVNVMTGSDGYIRGASGGHSDTAASAKMTVVVVPLMRGRTPSVVKNVQTIITPGETVDVLVTDRGVAVNPLRKDLIEKLTKAGVKMVDINDLQKQVRQLVGEPNPIEFEENIVGVIEYRDGTIIDVVKQVKGVMA
ncbi:MAG: citrate lyase subunit alpha [Clostridia bacterium]|nr:citrate lyase subunit alpha [Clostridia bacterium]